MLTMKKYFRRLEQGCWTYLLSRAA